MTAQQLSHVASMASIGPFDIADYHALLAPQPADDMELESKAPQPSQPSPGIPRSAHGVTVTIVDQPPEKCVYKRNVKPPPSVSISGQVSALDGVRTWYHDWLS